MVCYLNQWLNCHCVVGGGAQDEAANAPRKTRGAEWQGGMYPLLI